jgi:hypothetical protein
MLTLLLTVAAAASLQPTSPEDTIVVNGRKALNNEQALRAVNAISSSSELQMARYHEPVCPLVTGMSKEAGSLVESQIRELAKQVGAKTAGANCAANLIVMVAGDGQAMFSDIRRNRPEWLNGLEHGEIAAIAKQSGPVRAWSATSVRSEDGILLTPSKDGSAPATLRVQSASILKQPTRQQLDGSVIIIDREALNGRTLGEVAHFAAMRGLAMTRTPEVGEVNTVLSMFATKSGPRAMTTFDRDYLRSLYAGDGRDTGVQERRRMARAIAQQRG